MYKHQVFYLPNVLKLCAEDPFFLLDWSPFVHRYVLESFSMFFLVGYLCNCMLPKALKTSTVPHDSNFPGYDSEKKRLRSTFGCFTSISMHQREVSMSSLFLHSHYKGCLPPWELKGSRSRSMKEHWYKRSSCFFAAIFWARWEISPHFGREDLQQVQCLIL